MTFTCVNLPLTAAYYFGAPIAGMASVIAGYPPPMIGGRKRSRRRSKNSRKNKKVRYSKKLQRLRNKKRSANKKRKR